MAEELPELIVPDAAAWRSWLGEHHADRGVWLVLAKKGTERPTSLSYDEALDEALCHGWIDGQVRRRDEGTYVQRYTPRRSRSPWSKRNVGIIGRLVSEGRMRRLGPGRGRAGPGRRAVGFGVRRTGDHRGARRLVAALAAAPRAKAMFEILTSQNRYAILYRLDNAKRADTRARRLAEFVAMLERGETVYPQKRTLAD